MKNFRLNSFVLLLLNALTFWGFSAFAEEEIDLDAMEEPAPAPAETHSGGGSGGGLKIMGRVDLTVDFTKKQPTDTKKEADLKTYHFLLFLRTKVSEKVSFMGEFVNRSMYQISYNPYKALTMNFGKILVPFGDTQSFHHFYGGVGNYSGEGIMFPNIWAEEGVNFEWSLPSSELDLYVVNGFSNDATSGEPDFNASSDGSNHAGGFRYTTRHIPGVTAILSTYYEEWQPGKPLYLYGLDVTTGYGAINAPIVKGLRISTGIAEGDIKKVDTKDFKKSGNYFQLATNLIPGGEARFRIGAYVDDSRIETANDVHSFNAGWAMPIDAMKLLAEYQWNYEAKDETDNDLFRIMLSLDF